MKLQELFEDNKAAIEKEANDALKKLSDAIMKFLEDTSDDFIYDLEMKREIKGDRIQIHDVSSDSKMPAIGLSYRINRYIDDGKTVPIADLSIVLDVEHELSKQILPKMKSLISDACKSDGVHVSWSRSNPWSFKTSQRTTAEAVLIKLEKYAEEPKKASSSSGARYDPRAEFNNRPGEIARQRRVQGSAYSSSFGGDASNYRR